MKETRYKKQINNSQKDKLERRWLGPGALNSEEVGLPAVALAEAGGGSRESRVERKESLVKS